MQQRAVPSHAEEGELTTGPLRSHNDIVDRDVDQFDEESNESHDGEADGRGYGDLLKLCKTTGIR